MNSFIHKFSTGIATAALLALSAAPVAFANTDVSIDGNGAFSETHANISNDSSQNINQSSVSDFTNNVSTSQNTGRNSSSFNTGGNSSVETGSATSSVDISNEAGSNIASLPNCGCDNSSGSVEISGNGAFSKNDVKLNNSNSSNISQYNDSNINNMIDIHQSTGKNQSDFNTGGNWWSNGGSTTIDTGAATSWVNLNNQSGFNELQ